MLTMLIIQTVIRRKINIAEFLLVWCEFVPEAGQFAFVCPGNEVWVSFGLETRLHFHVAVLDPLPAHASFALVEFDVSAGTKGNILPVVSAAEIAFLIFEIDAADFHVL